MTALLASAGAQRLFLVTVRSPYSTCSRTYSAGLMLWARVRLAEGEEP